MINNIFYIIALSLSCDPIIIYQYQIILCGVSNYLMWRNFNYLNNRTNTVKRGTMKRYNNNQKVLWVSKVNFSNKISLSLSVSGLPANEYIAYVISHPNALCPADL